MKPGVDQLSSYLAIKGPLSETTYRAFSGWNLSLTVKENLHQLETTNSVGASSTGWLKQFIRVIKQRYDLSGPDRTLVELVHNGWSIDDWRPVQLWHMSRNDRLLWQFFTEWLFDCFAEGIVVIKVDAVVEYLRLLIKERLGSKSDWRENTFRRVASGLLKTAVEFHLMCGRVQKEFSAYRLPDRSFVYLLHALMEREQSTRRVIEAADWRLFLMRPAEVEEELLRLHQYGKLRFERAGSFLELTLPCENTEDFVRSAVG